MPCKLGAVLHHSENKTPGVYVAWTAKEDEVEFENPPTFRIQTEKVESFLLPFHFHPPQMNHENRNK